MPIDSFNTAYAQALSSNTKVPSYITASDTLSIANNNKPFLDSVDDAVEFIPRFIAASVISGANQLYNIPADIGNLFGGDFERSDTGDVIAGLDSDLGKFYEDNQAGVDLAGFIISSIIPGTAGIKVLNAGQKGLRTAINGGKFGTNTGRALGLLAPQKALLTTQATRQAIAGTTAGGIVSKKSLQAIGAGFGQGALEALAFETAVTATLFKSPILENQDLGDFMFNVALGAGLYGIVSGTVDLVKLNKAVKTATDNAALQARPYTFIDEVAQGTTRITDKIVLDYTQRFTIPPIVPNSDVSVVAKLTQAAATKRATLDTRIRTDLATLTGGDQDAAQALFNNFKGMEPQAIQSSLIGLEEASKFSVKTTKSARAEHLHKQMATGRFTPDEEAEYLASNISTKWVSIWGESAGTVLDEVPIITSLVDTLGKGQVITTTRNGIKAGSFKRVFADPVGKAAQTIKPWSIRAATAIEANARYIWAADLDKFIPTAKKPLNIHVDDIPLMEKVLLEVPEAQLQHVKFSGLGEGKVIGSSLQNFLFSHKASLANDLLKPLVDKAGKSTMHTQDEIAAIINVKASALNGELLKTPVSDFHIDDMLAMQNHAEVYTKQLINNGARRADQGLVDVARTPQTLRLTYDSTDFVTLDNHVIENMLIIKQQQRLYQDGTGRAVSGVIGKADYDRLPDINSGQVFSGAVPSGSGPGLVTAANANYGTLAAAMQDTGRVTEDIIGKAKASTRETLEPLLYKLGNNSEATIEWSTLNQRVRSIEGNYGINKAGDALEPLETLRWKAAAEEAVAAGRQPPKQKPLANPAMPKKIELATQEVRDLTRVHIEVNGVRTNGLAAIRTSQGTQFNRAPDAFYPIPVDPKDFPHFAIVTDRSITSGNQSKTLFARTADELDAQMAKLKQNPQWEVRTGPEAEAYFKSIGQHDYEKTLSNNYMDTEAHRKGVSAPFIVSTDPTKVTNDMLKWHMDRETGLVREAVSAKYEVQFEELMRLGDSFTNAQSSKFGRGSTFRDLEDVVKNPFGDYIKTALGIKKSSDYPWWVNTNRLADQAFSKMYNTIDDIFTKSKSPEDLLQINRELEKSGYKGAHYDEQMEIFANVGPDKGRLTNVVQKANAILATVVLRWDPLNAVNNAVSANVLLGAETAAVVRAINRGDETAVGKLAELSRTIVPGTGETIMSPSKMIGKAIQSFGTDNAEMQFFRDNGFITSISRQYADTLDQLAFNPAVDSISSWGARVDGLPSRLKRAGDLGEFVTGNKLAEEFNRFVAAHVMKQMTDVAVDAGTMTAKESLAYMNTFVNRTQGNYLASQRPMMFSGPIGQSIGLFQTYQFNLMQQMLRHVAEGVGKDTATLLALQGTIHGMNGLPGFNAINTHLLGTASGNTEHRDAYTETYGAFGKQAGDVLMYGVASNALGLLHPDLKVNLYTRGDINPRHVTLVPTDPASVPFIQAGSKVFANLFKTAKTLSQGGDVTTTLLQGLEHNSLSRPLAGLAQTLQGLNNPEQASYSTSKRGNVIAANDFLSIANLGRVLGGKPLDEAIGIDAMYRMKAYAALDSKRRTSLGAAIKTTMIAGQDPSLEQVEDFAQEYAKMGGRQQEFGKWYTQLYKTANQSQANKLQQNLKSPFSQSMQAIMGGQQLQDFSGKPGTEITP